MVEEIPNLNGNIKKEIKTRVARIWLDEEGIAGIVYLPGSEETLEDAEINHAALIKINGGKKRPLFINPELQKSVSREARIYYTKHAPEVATAVAGIITSPFIRIMANFYIVLNKTINTDDFPLKFFISEKKAFDWLREYLN
jgi:hypothetical protein